MVPVRGRARRAWAGIRRRAGPRAHAAGVALAAALAVALLVPGCIVLSDDAGVLVPREAADQLAPGMPRAEVLARLGPPTGRYSTDLLALVTRAADQLDEPVRAAAVDDDVLTWQHVRLRGTAAFFPLLFFWVNGRIASTTLTVFFDEQGRVRDVAWREDAP